MTNVNKKIISLNNEIKSNKAIIEDITSKVKKQEDEMNILLNESLNSSNQLFRNAVCNWVIENPIVAISYYKTIENSSRELFFKNDSKYIELFGSDEYDKDEKYVLIKKQNLSSIQYNTSDIIDYFSSLAYGDSLCLKLDFLDGLSINLIEEDGNFLHDNAWDISYKILNNVSSSSLYIKNSFSIIEHIISGDTLFNIL